MPSPPPVILLNGLAGSVMNAKLTHLAEVPHVYCSKDTKGKYEQIWVSADELLPGVIDCLFDNLQSALRSAPSKYHPADVTLESRAPSPLQCDVSAVHKQAGGDN